MVANSTDTQSATPETDWACTRDNVTGLIWSLENREGSINDIRDVALNPSKPRCGYTQWTGPKRRQLTNILDLGYLQKDVIQTYLDKDYFPNIKTEGYWAIDSASESSHGYQMFFEAGEASVVDFCNTTAPILD